MTESYWHAMLGPGIIFIWFLIMVPIMWGAAEISWRNLRNWRFYGGLIGGFIVWLCSGALLGLLAFIADR